LTNFGNGDDEITVLNTNKIDESLRDKIYGFNKFDNYKDDQVLMVINCKADVDTDEYREYLERIKKFNIIKNDISFNNINFDTYYDASIMNA
jgi:hypothetical protein